MAGLAAGACVAPSRSPPFDGISGVALERIEAGPKEDVVSALKNPSDPGLPKPLVDPSEIISGGPPPDGIPPIDDPQFVKAADAGWLDDREPVVVVEVGEAVRAYPVQILTWHEIVNDALGGIPVTVSYCPLCNSAVVFNRRAGERTFDFGTSGSLYRSSLVMYDRQTESLWSHFTGQAIAGVLTGTRLELLPASMVSFAEWKGAHPTGWVLSRDTGHERDYGRNPYEGYDEPKRRPFFFSDSLDERLLPKERVVGVRDGKQSVAVLLSHLKEEGVVEVSLGGEELVVLYKTGLASALDTRPIEEGKDVGQTGVFSRVISGRTLTFVPSDGEFRDLETGTLWSILGKATAGFLNGRALFPREHLDTFWFVWAAFRPETKVVG